MLFAAAPNDGGLFVAPPENEKLGLGTSVPELPPPNEKTPVDGLDAAFAPKLKTCDWGEEAAELPKAGVALGVPKALLVPPLPNVFELGAPKPEAGLENADPLLLAPKPELKVLFAGGLLNTLLVVPNVFEAVVVEPEPNADVLVPNPVFVLLLLPNEFGFPNPEGVPVPKPAPELFPKVGADVFPKVKVVVPNVLFVVVLLTAPKLQAAVFEP